MLAAFSGKVAPHNVQMPCRSDESITAWGRGLGKRLLQAVIDSSERHGIWTLCGAPFPENAASIQLQLACGFRIVGRRERIAQHHGVWRDTVLTERRSQVVGS